MEFDPQIPSYLTSDLSSFAHVSVRERWPVILDGIINDLTEKVNGVLDAIAEAEGKRVIDGVVALKADILSDAKLTLKREWPMGAFIRPRNDFRTLLDDRFNDIAGYSKELAREIPHG
ncbi:hypothetical protein ASPCAL04801 [Aspergillus calidoustus]|uniref:Uncharacterized protein n=1 Tax=Aspergillus calidoustus TaxID=454130 RepID=A0A0U5FWD6_ASPCI|nr:hypothetical protein ASPCAL04801 [Aspergillus calidoustus]